jgi:hypothetical protein
MATDPPMLADFAKTIDVSVRTLNRWAVEVDESGNPRHPDFVEAYTRARELQEATLARGATLGLYDARFVQFALKNLAGWADQPVKASEVAPISTEELERLYLSKMRAAHERQAQVRAERRAMLANDLALA